MNIVTSLNSFQGISVVIPVFNRESLIKGTLDSVRSQTHRPVEIVVIDDGSEDNTTATVKTWANSNANELLTVKCITQNNQGANAARNRGITESSHSIIAFLDSDDRWLPEKLKKQLDALENDHNLGGVYCGLQTVDLASGEIQPQMPRKYETGDLLASMLVQDVSNPTSCWMVRKACFETVGDFDTSLPARQDWDMWIRLSANFKIGCSSEILVEMGEHSGERVRSDPAREIIAHRVIFAKYRGLRSQLPFWVNLQARSAMYRRRGRVYLHRKSARTKAIGCHLAAISIWPFEFDSYAALLGTFLTSGIRHKLHLSWNRFLGATSWGIRSH